MRENRRIKPSVYTGGGVPSIPKPSSPDDSGERARLHWTNSGKPRKIQPVPAQPGIPVVPDPLSVVTDYLAALHAFDYDRARACLADEGFEFSSPTHRFQSADDFIRHLSLAGGIIQSAQTRKVFVDGADLCHILTYRIQISEKQDVAVAQWTRVLEGRIVRMEIIFDASVYRDLFPDE